MLHQFCRLARPAPATARRRRLERRTRLSVGCFDQLSLARCLKLRCVCVRGGARRMTVRPAFFWLQLRCRSGDVRRVTVRPAFSGQEITAEALFGGCQESDCASTLPNAPTCPLFGSLRRFAGQSHRGAARGSRCGCPCTGCPAGRGSSTSRPSPAAPGLRKHREMMRLPRNQRDCMQVG